MLERYRAAWLKWRSWPMSKLALPVTPAQAIYVALFVPQLERIANGRNLGFRNRGNDFESSHAILWLVLRKCSAKTDLEL